MKGAIKTACGWLVDAFNVLFPETCLICENRLNKGEKFICSLCFQNLPFTEFHGKRGNVTERLFWYVLPIERANSYIYYNVGSEGRKPILWLKYFDLPEVGVFLGRIMARDLIDSDFFDGIDMIIPLPLSKSRLKKRGYNQSRKLAEGVSQITGLPINDKVVVRVVDNPTQTKLTHKQRIDNVEGIFRLMNPDEVAGKHVLLIDDVVTTNATLTSCGKEILKAGNVRISILTLGIAGSHFSAKMVSD